MESATIVLLIPIVGVVVPSGITGGVWRDRVGGILRALGATTPLAQLAVLQARFVEHLRNRVLAMLATAPWSSIVSLRHARVTNLLGMEMQRIGSSGQF